jgi:hypothetical protein
VLGRVSDGIHESKKSSKSVYLSNCSFKDDRGRRSGWKTKVVLVRSLGDELLMLEYLNWGAGAGKNCKLQAIMKRR